MTSLSKNKEYVFLLPYWNETISTISRTTYKYWYLFMNSLNKQAHKYTD